MASQRTTFRSGGVNDSGVGLRSVWRSGRGLARSSRLVEVSYPGPGLDSMTTNRQAFQRTNRTSKRRTGVSTGSHVRLQGGMLSPAVRSLDHKACRQR